MLKTVGIGLFATAVSGSALLAQDTLGGVDVIPLADWGYDELYQGGVSAERYMEDVIVYGENGEEIGNIEDILIGPDGKVLSVIAEVGGFWDIGDTHVSVPFDMVEANAAGDGITVPVTEDNVGDYGFMDGWREARISAESAETDVVSEVDDAEVSRAWRATELIGDTARVRNGENETYRNYGYINDLILSNGMVTAVVVDLGARGMGYRAYPYYGRGAGTGNWNAGSAYYDTPYSGDDIDQMDRFELQRIGS